MVSFIYEVIMSGLVTLTGTDNGIVGSQHSIRSKVVYYARTTGQGYGSETLTGAGFSPVACIFLGSNFYFGFGGGYAAVQEDGTLIQATSTVYYQTGDFGSSDDAHIYKQTSGSTEGWQATFQAFTADGGTILFDPEYTPSSSLTYAIMWLR